MLLCSKETTMQMREQHTEMAKMIFMNHSSNERLISKICKNANLKINLNAIYFTVDEEPKQISQRKV